jgi:hypothetical protein
MKVGKTTTQIYESLKYPFRDKTRALQYLSSMLIFKWAKFVKHDPWHSSLPLSYNKDTAECFHDKFVVTIHEWVEILGIAYCTHEIILLQDLRLRRVQNVVCRLWQGEKGASFFNMQHTASNARNHKNFISIAITDDEI